MGMADTKIIYDTWTKLPEWHGNPELGLDCWVKHFNNTFTGRRTPVYIFGKEGSGKNKPCYGDRPDGANPEDYITHYQDFPDYMYCVSAGANSEYSYSGSCYPQLLNAEQMQDYVDKLHETKKLFK